MKRNTSRICKSCTEEFNPARPWQQYCSRKCQIRYGMKRYRNRKTPAKCHNITGKVSRYPNAITPASTPLLEALEPLSYGFGRPGDPPLPAVRSGPPLSYLHLGTVRLTKANIRSVA